MSIKPHENKWLVACEILAPVFSTCAKRQYFSVIIGPNKRLLAQGYNGSPPGYEHCIDNACPRLSDNSAPGSSYGNCIAQHAEAGALLWSNRSEREGATLIVNGPPCFECAKLIASSGIAKVVCFSDDNYVDWQKVKNFMEKSGIEVVTVPKTIGMMNKYVEQIIEKVSNING